MTVLAELGLPDPDDTDELCPGYWEVRNVIFGFSHNALSRIDAAAAAARRRLERQSMTSFLNDVGLITWGTAQADCQSAWPDQVYLVDATAHQRLPANDELLLRFIATAVMGEPHHWRDEILGQIQLMIGKLARVGQEPWVKLRWLLAGQVDNNRYEELLTSFVRGGINHVRGQLADLQRQDRPPGSW